MAAKIMIYSSKGAIVHDFSIFINENNTRICSQYSPYTQLVHHPVEYIMVVWRREASKPGKVRTTVLQNIAMRRIK
jgi:hypothetical protein